MCGNSGSCLDKLLVRMIDAAIRLAHFLKLTTQEESRSSLGGGGTRMRTVLYLARFAR